jgi:predicted ATPase/predicted Ser/Thr protein kinase
MPVNWFENSDPTGLLTNSIWSECEDRIHAFEKAWRQGSTPAIGDFLCASGPVRNALLVELVSIDLEFRLQRGEAARVGSYWDEFPELAEDRSVALELIAAEYELRRRFEGDVRLEDYRDRFPNYHRDLCHRLRAVETDAVTPTGMSGVTGAMPWPSVPGYEIAAEIGRGGMGVVYQAREASLGRQVALKFLPVDFARDADRLQRFLREARTASALNHPHICVVHALGKHEDRPFIVMEFIDGETLRARVAGRPDVEQAARWIAQAARALATAHAAGVIHRDIKPENIMVRRDGYVKVLDFGLARRLPTLTDRGGNSPHPGALVGTVGYMSPEQAHGVAVDSAADIFSLGIVLYELVTGRHPFEADSALATLHAIANRLPAAPSRLNPEAPAALDGLTEAMLQKNPRLRPTAAEVEKVLTALATDAPRNMAPAAPRRAIVHREPELAALAAALERADAGRGEFVCIAGETGIGKTTLVEDFLASEAVANRNCLIARGRCSERLADTEAYLPVIDALQNMLQTSARATMGRLMKVVAPTWYVQLAAVARDALDAGASETTRAFSQQALLREFRSFWEEASRLGPVILFFDDVHWADNSTVDLLAHVGRHCQGMRVLVIVSYRPTELLLGPHPFHGVKLELQTHGACGEILLGFLGREQVDRYLSLAFPGHAFPDDFAALIHSRTEGSPLFVADLLRYLRERGVLAELGGRWSLARELPDLLADLPGSVRSMIERKLQRLSDVDRRLLAAASVLGSEFDSAVVARALALDVAEVDERLQVLERVHDLVRTVREHQFPDAALTLRYAFVHVLYQQALYSGLPSTRRALLAVALARALEEHHTDGNTEAAAALACLYQVGRDYGKAARHFWIAAQNHARVFAHREAIELARRGLRLLESMPDTSERADMELPLQTTLGLQLQVTEGFAAADARSAYRRACELCTQLSKPELLFPVLWGLWLFSKVRSELHRAKEMAEELHALAGQLQDPALALQAQQALAMTAFCRGEPAAAVRHVEQATALYDPNRHHTLSHSFGQDPAILCKAIGAVALWLLGRPEQATRQGDATIHASRTLSPSSQVVALHFGAMVHQLRRDTDKTRACAAEAGRIAAEHGFAFWSAGANILMGWAANDVDQLRNGLFDWQATDSVTYQTYYLGLLAEVLGGQGHVAEPLRLLDEALLLAEQTGEGLYEAELHRLRGEILLHDVDEPIATRVQRAETAFRRAISVAQAQEATSLELRATLSLARLLRDHDQAAAAREPLSKAMDKFTEGRDTPDLREAAKVLAEFA